MGGLVLWTCRKLLRSFNHADSTVDHIMSSRRHGLLRQLPLTTITRQRQLMPMTHTPETSARNRRQFSEAGFWRWFLECVSLA